LNSRCRTGPIAATDSNWNAIVVRTRKSNPSTRQRLVMLNTAMAWACGCVRALRINYMATID